MLRKKWQPLHASSVSILELRMTNILEGSCLESGGFMPFEFVDLEQIAQEAS